MLVISFVGTSGSDSPGQAVEAEEIVKQLELEQVDEITTSTATSATGGLYSGQAVTAQSPSPDSSSDNAEDKVASKVHPMPGIADLLDKRMCCIFW